MQNKMTKQELLLEAFDAESYDRVPITRQWYQQRLRPYLEFLNVEGIDLADSGPREVKRFLTKLQDAGFARSTRSGTYTALGVFYKWLVDRGHVEQNPFKVESIKRPRKTQQVQNLIELEALQKLFDTIRSKDSPMVRRDYAIILLIFDTGLRRAEAISLKISDINMNNREITVREAKNDNQRIVPFKNTVLQALKSWLEVHPTRAEGQLFIALTGQNKGQRLSPRRVNGILERWIREAELEGSNRVTPHGLRRAFATYFSDTGGDMFALRDILGHKKIETTTLYVINTRSRLQMQHEKHSPINLLKF